MLEDLSEYISNRTVLYITHKLEITHKTDLIMVFDHGILVEIGKHEELLSQKGYFYKLCYSKYHTDI